MAEIDKEVHGFKIQLPHGDSDTLNNAIHSFKHDMSRDDMEHLLHDARHAPEGKLHLEDGKTTLVHNGDGTYTLRKRNL